VDSLCSTLGADPRFYVDFHPVGKWGGPNDDKLQPCDVADGRNARVELFRNATDRGFDLRNLRQRFQPHGSSCYAADPNSFVIGSDGTVYKCTVAFDDSRNQVGRVTPDGDLLLDQEKLSLWVSKGEETDSTCQSCSFRPSCQGNACPWARIRTGQTPCPSDKINIDDTLRLLAAEAVKQREKQPVDAA
jgi:uncharacterized protein